MLDKNDIQILRQMFTDTKVEMRDEMRACISGSEHRIMKETKTLIRELKEEILDGVSDIVGNEILPQIDDHEARLVRLEHRTV